jgi:hypothetical protein
MSKMRPETLDSGGNAVSRWDEGLEAEWAKWSLRGLRQYAKTEYAPTKASFVAGWRAAQTRQIAVGGVARAKRVKRTGMAFVKALQEDMGDVPASRKVANRLADFRRALATEEEG